MNAFHRKGKWVSIEGFGLTSRQDLQTGNPDNGLSHSGLTNWNPDNCLGKKGILMDLKGELILISLNDLKGLQSYWPSNFENNFSAPGIKSGPTNS